MSTTISISDSVLVMLVLVDTSVKSVLVVVLVVLPKSMVDVLVVSVVTVNVKVWKYLDRLTSKVMLVAVKVL